MHNSPESERTFKRPPGQPIGCIPNPATLFRQPGGCPIMSTTDRIEKQIVLRAPRSRVWRALTDADEFGAWFRAKLESPFREGAIVRGHITYPGYEHLKMELHIQRIEPERLFS